MFVFVNRFYGQFNFHGTRGRCCVRLFGRAGFMRLSSSWRHISLLLRPGDLPVSFWGSVHDKKAMKALLPGGCEACRNVQHGYRLNYSRGSETHPQKIPVKSLMVARTTSTVDANENGINIVPNYSSKFSSLQQGLFRTQRAGSNPFRGISDARAVEYGRSSGRKISAIESTGTSRLMDEVVGSGSDDEQNDEQTRKTQEMKESKKRSKDMKKLIKGKVKEELKRFFAEALERQNEDNEPEDVASQVVVVEEEEEVKTSIKRKAKIYFLEEEEEFEDVDGEEDDFEGDEDQVEDLEDVEDREGLGEVAVEVVEEVEEVEASVTLEMTQDEVAEDELDDEIADDGEDEDFWDDDAYPQDPEVGDGEDGGGMVLDDAEWGKTALALASETLEKNFDSDFSLFAFKLSKDAGLIRIRLDKLTDKYGSPTLNDIEKFSSIYGKLLEVEGLAKRLPDNLALEVSSPGAERVVRVPKELERFKELPMYVRYTVEGGGEESVKDGIWQVDRVEEDKAVWKLANVRANREVAGKGRPLNKKQKEWRLELPFSDTQLVRLYLDV